MRRLWLLAVLLTPAALAQTNPSGEVVDVSAVRAPDLVVVDRTFSVSVDLVNRASTSKNVQLYSFLYVDEEGKTCGTQVDPRFLGPVDRGARPSLTLAAKSTTTFPAAGALPWHHIVNASQVPGPGTYQLCVIAYEPNPSQGFLPYDQRKVLLPVRVENTLPAVDFEWSPSRGNVTTTFRFRVDAGDDPEGDALSFAWEFGHLTTQGTAVGTGREVTHAFYHFSPFPRTYLVNLTVRDGFDSHVVRKSIVVEPEGTPAPQAPVDRAVQPWWAIPGPEGALLALALTSLALVQRARSR